MGSIQKPSSTINSQTTSNQAGWNLVTSKSEIHRENSHCLVPNPRKRAHLEEVEDSLDLRATFPPSENDTTETALDTSARAKAIEFIKYWLVTYPKPFPHAKQIHALADLCSLPPPFVETLLNEILREQSLQKPGVVGPIQVDKPPSKRIKPTPRTRPQKKISDAIPDRTNLNKVALWVKEHPPKRRSTSEPKLLHRDASKIYQCTQSCGTSFGRKDDWRRHEEQHYPQEGWICDLDATAIVKGILTCSYCDTQDPETDHAINNHQKRAASNHCKNKPLDARGRIFYRKEHFLHHLDKIHPSIPSAEHVTQNHFVVDSSFPRRCGFCVQYQFRNWQDRIEHLGRHFEDGKTMPAWKPPHSIVWHDSKGLNGDERPSLSNLEIFDNSPNANSIISQDLTEENFWVANTANGQPLLTSQIPEPPGFSWLGRQSIAWTPPNSNISVQTPRTAGLEAATHSTASRESSTSGLGRLTRTGSTLGSPKSGKLQGAIGIDDPATSTIMRVETPLAMP